MPPGEGEGGEGAQAGAGGAEPTGQATPPSTTSSSGSASTTTTPPAEEPFDQERAMQTIRQLRDSERGLKRQLGEVNTELSAIREAQKTQEQKDQEELERLRGVEQKYVSETRDRIARDAFTEEARKAGASKPDALFRLADGLEFDSDGKPTNASDVVKKLKGEYPELFSVGSADGGAGRGQAPAPKTMSDLLRQSRR